MGTQICQACRKEFDTGGFRGRFRYCEEHRLSRNEAKARDQRNLRARRRVVKAPPVCQRCGTGFQRTGSYQKWCTECRPIEAKLRWQEYEKRQQHPCPDCGAPVGRKGTQCKACGQKTAAESRSGPNHSNWKGGRSKDRYGYIHILVAPEARKGHRYQPEHRLVWEAANGPLPKGWRVHHINRIKDDNRLENLVALSMSEHSHEHGERRIRELEAEVARLREQLAWKS